MILPFSSRDAYNAAVMENYPLGPSRSLTSISRSNKTISAAASAALLLVVACHKLDDADLGAVEHRLKWHQEPNTEIEDCHVFKLDNEDRVEVDRIRIAFPPGGHHVHVYRSDTPEPDSVQDCWSGIDWTQWHLVLGTQTEAMDWRLPEGLTVPLDPHQQLLVQVHWLNTTEASVDRAIDLEFHVADRTDAHVGVILGINKQTAMQPHERKVIRQWCAMPEGSKLLAMMGHFHGLGQKYSVVARPQATATGVTLYEALGEQTFRFKSYTPPYEVPPGDGFEFECDFYNYRDIPIVWSSDVFRGEHCNMFAYFYPAGDELSQLCMNEKAEVRTIDGPRARVLPNDQVSYTVDLTEEVTADSELRLDVSNPWALSLPAVVQIPKGERSITVQGRALAPGRATVTATFGSTGKSTVTSIAGLVLSELRVGEVGETDRRQWVELSNVTDLPIDLSHYSLGAGSADYTRVRLGLTATMPARGCVVIGGPEPTSIDQPPYDQPHDFDPDFDVGVGGGYGVALFDAPAEQITAQSLPYDALVFGDRNNVLRGPDGELVPAVARPPTNGTYARVSEQLWVTQAVATPRNCEVR